MHEAELQARLLFALIVAGKSATFAEKKLRLFLSCRDGCQLPFDYLASLVRDDALLYILKCSKTGNYTKLHKAFRWLAEHGSELDLTKATPEELECIPGCGPKTSRFFILWTRPDARCAALDVHILRWLRSQGYLAPWATPSDRAKYRHWENVFLQEADKLNMTPAALDAQIWEAGSRKTMSQRVSQEEPVNVGSAQFT